MLYSYIIDPTRYKGWIRILTLDWNSNLDRLLTIFLSNGDARRGEKHLKYFCKYYNKYKNCSKQILQQIQNTTANTKLLIPRPGLNWRTESQWPPAKMCLSRILTKAAQFSTLVLFSSHFLKDKDGSIVSRIQSKQHSVSG